jgi:hypothetical protein
MGSVKQIQILLRQRAMGKLRGPGRLVGLQADQVHQGEPV